MKSSVRPASGPPAGDRLEHAHRRRADGEHALRARIRCQAAGSTAVPLAVDVVLLDDLRLQRPERVEPDVQGDALDVEAREELRREVQAGRRAPRPSPRSRA